MYMDFHCHTKISKKFEFELDRFKRIIKTAKKNGLDAIALTEHFHTVNFYNIYKTLDQNYEYKDDYYDVDGFKVFCGMEVDIKEKGHIIIVGRKEDLLDLRGLFPEVITEKEFPTLEYLIAEAEKRNLIKVGAHPAKRSKYLVDMDPSLLNRLDGLGLNGKALNLKDEVAALSKRVNVPMVAGSDTHHVLHMGTVKNRFYAEHDTIAGIKKAIANREFETVITKGAKLKAAAGQVAKKIAKRFKELKESQAV
ncbi:PHP domain-containing protein [Orenia marismortui]|uniref:Polymerase/histidinol phosphatase N-terminal domain-containing protein n=1 Tax=Orenia marismortui TaxID=46469 RepID=A0A4R8HL48_9FIRM|nr:PHP domain-containing protein [Orenia marismortui]TDX59004.1 hypothetical protein C7959_102142 [Orenia marismortui]